MCGITGFINTNVTKKQLLNSVKALHHRGPDGAGLYQDLDNNVSLGHTRLSIIGLDSGDQPIISSDGAIILVCNGEIYDFESIRTDLQSKGHQFETGSDSEVILYLYREYGMEFLKDLRGEFAFILYDRIQKTVYAVKDRFGIKPLYYVKKNGKLLLGSESKAIFASGLHCAKIDPLKLRDSLSFMNINTIFEGVSTVPPGCFLKINLQGDVEINRYWDIHLPKKVTPLDLDDAMNNIRNMMENAVNARLRADVPVGVYLSAGIDSAIIASTVSKFFTGELKTFTISFNESTLFDEAEIAEKQANAIGAKSYTLICNRHNLFGNLEDSLWHTELPAFNLHGVGKFLLSKLAREHVKVVLTGEGADEVFLGYPYFKNECYSSAESLQTGKTSNTEIAKDNSKEKEYLQEEFGFIPQIEMIESLNEKRQFLLHKLFNSASRSLLKQHHPANRLKRIINRDNIDGLSFEQKRQYFSIKGTLATYILTVLGDRQEMAHSLEGRVPFLDHKLFEYVKNIPTELKIKNNNEKYVLKEAFKDRVIPDIYNRTKHHFSAPQVIINKKNCPACKDMIEKFLSRRAIKKADVFNVYFVKLLQLVSRIIFWKSKLKENINLLLLYILSTQVIHDQFVINLISNINKRCPTLNIKKDIVVHTQKDIKY